MFEFHCRVRRRALRRGVVASSRWMVKPSGVGVVVRLSFENEKKVVPCSGEYPNSENGSVKPEHR